jgi:hypothetical protein
MAVEGDQGDIDLLNDETFGEGAVGEFVINKYEAAKHGCS